MSTLEIAHDQLGCDLNSPIAGTRQAPTRAATAARCAVLSSLHDENGYRNKHLDNLQLQIDAWQPRCRLDYSLAYNTLRKLHAFPHDVFQPEEDLVYRQLIQRDTEDAEEFTNIRHQHENILALSNRLLQQLNAISHGGKSARRERLRPQLQHFIDTFRQHINAEENAVFPTAEKWLLDSDWHALQSGSSYLEAVNGNANGTITKVDYQTVEQQVSPARHSLTHAASQQTERVTAGLGMAQLHGAYSLADAFGRLTDCTQQLTELGIKQAKNGLNASLDEIMACRDTSSGIVDLPGNLLRATLHNTSDTWRAAREIVTRTWQPDLAEKSRAKLLHDV